MEQVEHHPAQAPSGRAHRSWLRFGLAALVALTVAVSGVAVVLWQRTVTLDAQVRQLTAVVGQTRDDVAVVKVNSTAPTLSRAVSDLNGRVGNLEGAVGPMVGVGDSLGARLDALESEAKDLGAAAAADENAWNELRRRVSIVDADVSSAQSDLSDLCTTLAFEYQVRATC